MTDPAAPPADPTPPAVPPSDPPKSSRPDYLPEKFWDAEASAPRIETLAKSYGELEKKLGAKPEARAPETYELPNGMTIDGLPENYRDRVTKLVDRARELDMTQDQMAALIGSAIGSPHTVAADLAKVTGDADKARTILENAEGFIRSRPEAEAAALRALMATADGVQAVNSLRDAFRERSLPTGDTVTGMPSTLPELKAELRRAVGSEDYGDPAKQAYANKIAGRIAELEQGK